MRDARAMSAPRIERTDALPEASGVPTALVELLFFAYRDFVGEPDRILSRYGFGRAHHRVLHFVNRNPGLTIAELLDILGITKQSLARVLRDLVASGFIEQCAGLEDRRQRLLFLSETGQLLAAELLALQTSRVERALAKVSPGERAGIEAFLFGLIDVPQHGDAAHVASLDPARRMPAGRR